MVETIKGKVYEDYTENKVRFIAESIGWACSIFAAALLALTQPDPAFYICYPVWLINTILFSICAWSRGSCFLFLNYILLLGIDSIGYYRWALL